MTREIAAKNKKVLADEKIRKLVLALVYQNPNPLSTAEPILPFAKVSKVMGLKPHIVRKIVKEFTSDADQWQNDFQYEAHQN